MKNNQEILDEFGKKIIKDIYDEPISYFQQIIKNQTKWGTDKELTEFLSKVKLEEKKIIFEYIMELLRTNIFSMLGIFEENEQFKLIYEKDGKQINLVEISEMLKAELLGENGWIKRFSKYADEYEV